MAHFRPSIAGNRARPFPRFHRPCAGESGDTRSVRSKAKFEQVGLLRDVAIQHATEETGLGLIKEVTP
jgi:hypothetical protein